MLEAKLLPELASNLVPALTHLQGDDLARHESAVMCVCVCVDCRSECCLLNVPNEQRAPFAGLAAFFSCLREVAAAYKGPVNDGFLP
jgi:hypothetical protein